MTSKFRHIVVRTTQYDDMIDVVCRKCGMSDRLQDYGVGVHLDNIMLFAEEHSHERTD